MRKQPGSPPPITLQQKDKIITQVREYQLITPLFGGGVTPNEADPITTIRGTEIRGQLRFWWRACRGGQFDSDLTKMKSAENALWGAAYKKDEVTPTHDETIQIFVETISTGKPVNPFKADGKPDPNSGIPDYAAFPLQPTDKDRRKKEVLRDIRFKLTISFPEPQKSEVEAALWAWETFGGIGARTRRGFGALHLLSVNGFKNVGVDKTKLQAWIQDNLKKYIEKEEYPKDVPHLYQNLEFCVINSRQGTSPLDIWRNLIQQLKNFRQARSKGNTGRSIWPEAETVRHLTGQRDETYSELQHPQKFPRAAFGLPIIFHFKDEKKGDPKDSTLKGINSERLASPLILRPLSCANNQAVGLALLLRGTHPMPEPLLLDAQNGSHNIQEMLTKSEAQSNPILQGKTDVLQTFMDYLKKGAN